MLMDVTKEDLINMICGGPMPPMEMCDRMTQDGIMKFTGNQHNPDWKWNRDWLAQGSEINLAGIYRELKLKNFGP